MKGRIEESKFGGPIINWTWEPVHGTVEGIIEYLQECDGALLRWYDFNKHPHIGRFVHGFEHEARKDKRIYHFENEHPNPAEGHIPRMQGTITTFYKNLIGEKPVGIVDCVGYSNISIIGHKQDHESILLNTIQALDPRMFIEQGLRNDYHLHLWTPRPEYKPAGVAI